MTGKFLRVDLALIRIFVTRMLGSDCVIKLLNIGTYIRSEFL